VLRIIHGLIAAAAANAKMEIDRVEVALYSLETSREPRQDLLRLPPNRRTSAEFAF
jgi:hypothetical protein